MAAPPVQPVRGMPGRARAEDAGGEQAPDLRNGQRDHPGIGGRRLIRPDGRRHLGIGAVFEQRGGDGADRQGGHHQHDMACDRDIEPDLALV